MNIALINFSPKGNSSNSKFFIDYMKNSFSPQVSVVELKINTCGKELDLQTLSSCETWVFFYPLYVDALPSHMLDYISRLEKTSEISTGKKIYAVTSCGFHEGLQTCISLEILANWCAASGTEWCGAVGIGASGCFHFFEKYHVESGPRIPVNRALEVLAFNVENGVSQCNNYVTVALPKRLYKLAAEIFWRKDIVSNGKKIKDLSRQL